MRSQAKSADVWPQERQGYHETVTPAYAALPKSTSARYPTSVKTEERIGSLVAGVGIIMIAQTVTHNFAGITRIGILSPGPLEVCAIGILIWLHGKWRRAARRF